MQIDVLGYTVHVLCTCKPFDVALCVTYTGRAGSAGKLKVPDLHRPPRMHSSIVIEHIRLLVAPKGALCTCKKLSAPGGGDAWTPHVGLCKYLENGVVERRRF